MVFAIGRPIEMLVSSTETACTADQMVVSVGPYILRSWPTPEPSNCRASASGKASPPTSSTRRRPSALRTTSSCASMLASDGVHCMWVTP